MLLGPSATSSRDHRGRVTRAVVGGALSHPRRPVALCLVVRPPWNHAYKLPDTRRLRQHRAIRPRALHRLPRAVRALERPPDGRGGRGRRRAWRAASTGATPPPRRGAVEVIPIEHYVALSAISFAIGGVGFLVRRNVLSVLMSIELMLNAVNLAFVAFNRAATARPHGSALRVLPHRRRGCRGRRRPCHRHLVVPYQAYRAHATKPILLRN